MSEKAEKEAANWTKGSIGLTITKTGLTPAIIEKWKGYTNSLGPEIRDHLPNFLENLVKETSGLEYNKGRVDRWIITGKCPCNMRLCQAILTALGYKQERNSINVVWRPKAEESKLYTCNAGRTTLPYVTRFAERCFICREVNCPFERNRQGVPLFNDELSHEIVNIYWPLANMYMFRGKEKNKFPNTRPEDTDAALIFKLMKNCTLFQVVKDDVDDGIYDDLLEVRNILMHSPDNRLSDDALDECFDRMVKILEQFSNEYSEKAIKELEKLKDMRIIMTTLTSEEASIVKQAFDLQQSALKFEMNVTGTLKNDYVLEGILKASQVNSQHYTGNATQRDTEPKSQTQSDTEPKSQTQRDTEPKSQKQGGAATAAGATTGAVIGSIAGPPGAILGAAVGALYGKLFE